MTKKRKYFVYDNGEPRHPMPIEPMSEPAPWYRSCGFVAFAYIALIAALVAWVAIGWECC